MSDSRIRHIRDGDLTLCGRNAGRCYFANSAAPANCPKCIRLSREDTPTPADVINLTQHLISQAEQAKMYVGVLIYDSPDELNRKLVKVASTGGSDDRLRKALEDLTNFAWSAVRTDTDSAAIYLNSLLAKARLALSSTPVSDKPEGEALADNLFDAIKHGDDDHRAWLQEALRAYFAGKPVPAPRGGGRKEARIAELERALGTRLASLPTDKTGDGE